MHSVADCLRISQPISEFQCEYVYSHVDIVSFHTHSIKILNCTICELITDTDEWPSLLTLDKEVLCYALTCKSNLYLICWPKNGIGTKVYAQTVQCLMYCTVKSGELTADKSGSQRAMRLGPAGAVLPPEVVVEQGQQHPRQRDGQGNGQQKPQHGQSLQTRPRPASKSLKISWE